MDGEIRRCGCGQKGTRFRRSKRSLLVIHPLGPASQLRARSASPHYQGNLKPFYYIVDPCENIKVGKNRKSERNPPLLILPLTIQDTRT